MIESLLVDLQSVLFGLKVHEGGISPLVLGGELARISSYFLLFFSGVGTPNYL